MKLLLRTIAVLLAACLVAVVCYFALQALPVATLGPGGHGVAGAGRAQPPAGFQKGGAQANGAVPTTPGQGGFAGGGARPGGSGKGGASAQGLIGLLNNLLSIAVVTVLVIFAEKGLRLLRRKEKGVAASPPPAV